LAWLIRITEVDPLPFGLLFERFLNPARISMPDFDIDFEDTLREKVIEYVRQKYGEDKVSAIGTYMQMASKAAFKDVARVIGLPFEKSNQISALMPDKM
jgi:DNA polymerase-3 subunit alpha